MVKVADKIFAFFGSADGSTIGLKCGRTSDEAREWRDQYPDDVTVTAYIGRYGWNTFVIGSAIADAELREAIDTSYADVVGRLPKSKRPTPADDAQGRPRQTTSSLGCAPAIRSCRSDMPASTVPDSTAITRNSPVGVLFDPGVRQAALPTSLADSGVQAFPHLRPVVQAQHRVVPGHQHHVGRHRGATWPIGGVLVTGREQRIPRPAIRSRPGRLLTRRGISGNRPGGWRQTRRPVPTRSTTGTPRPARR